MSIDTLPKRMEGKTTSRISSPTGRLGILAALSATAALSCTSDARSAHNGNGEEKDAASVVQEDTFSPPQTDTPAGHDTGHDTVLEPGHDTIPPDTEPQEPDDDGDGIPNSEDPCMQRADLKDQDGKPINTDGDAMPDACDSCPTKSDDGTDSDNDGVGDACDNAPNKYNPSQADDDLDGVGNVNDICPQNFDPAQTDADGDGYGAACGDCNDNDANVNPGALDAPCDGEDTDCDGNAEDADTGCVCKVGAIQTVDGSCADGEQTCVLTGAETSGWVATTDPDNGIPEVCANDVDDDCDGMIDNASGCVDECAPGATQDCGQTKGECGKQLGTATCDGNGAWGACVGDTQPTAEDCDGLDNNCNGETDENFGIGEPCAPKPKGVCGEVDGHKECFGTQATICSTAPGGSEDQSAAEICDEKDNDCNGVKDDKLFSVVGGADGEEAVPGTACKGVGECKTGVFKCVANQAVQCNAFDKAAQTDACDKAEKDEDCDGVSNPGCECTDGDKPKECQTLANVCEKGEQTCDDGHWSDCKGEVKGVGETCDGVDNNCDGVTDNLPTGTAGVNCKGKMGVCAEIDGKFECDGNGGVVCTSEYAATQEVCGNKLDDDCDGKKDEGPFTVVGGKVGEMANPGEACETGVGECKGPGVLVCASDSAVECDNGKTPGTEVPDSEGKDEDCDGAFNEGFDCKSGDKPKSCQSQPQVCNAGEQKCVGGEWSECEGEKLGTAEVCNGADDDCNGTADDGFNVNGDCKGKGVCGDGELQCDPKDSTKTMCSTMPGGKDDQSGKEVCNGLDDDCNGIVDDLTDGTAGKACPGTGVCAAGVLECEDGKLQCSTMEGGSQYVGTKEVCDGKDNNCDGATDEGEWAGKGAVGLPCPTGVGACEGQGYTVCATEQSTECSNNKNASLEKADKIDNDCDGTTDEGFDCVKGETQSCGGDFEIGICKMGIQVCEADNNTWSECGGKYVGPNPELCDGIDNDCNGEVDNGFNVGNVCWGQGECAKTPGISECDPDDPASKHLTCSTGPKGSSSQASDEVCDGKDNNCNGKTDEEIGNLGQPGDKCVNPGVCGEGTVVCDGKSDTKCKTPVMPGEKGEACNGKDDDCDGSIDEGFGVGEPCKNNCGDQGVMQCNVDGLVAECSAKIKSEIPGNGVDDDCDGQVDEQP